MQRINIVFHLRTLAAPGSLLLFFYPAFIHSANTPFYPGAPLSTRMSLILQVPYWIAAKNNTHPLPVRAFTLTFTPQSLLFMVTFIL